MLGNIASNLPSVGTADPRILWTTGVIVASYVAIQVIKKATQGKQMPGPWGWPIVGHVFSLGKNADTHLQLTEWSKEYGPVYKIKLGTKNVVVISGWKAYRQALIYQAEAFAGRPDYYTFRHIICDGKTLAFNTYSPRFKLHKQILVNGLKKFLKSSDPPVDVAVEEEAHRLIANFLKHKDEAFDPYPEMLNSCLYVICGLLFGFSYPLCQDREAVAKIGNVDHTREAEGAGSNVVDFFPYIRPFLMKTLKGMLEECHGRMAMIKEIETDHLKDYDANHLRDIMDVLIKAGDDLSEEQTKAGLTKEFIMSTAFTLLNAGSDTLAGMLYWASLYCAIYPEIQDKLQAEVDEVVDPDRLPNNEDRSYMHYTEAFLNEVMRYCVLTPFLIPHATTKDVDFMGYHIPEGHVVFCNMWSVSRDPEVWEDPDTFRPSRWLDDEGRLNKNILDNFYPFSAGKRRCIGESMARMEFFLFFSAIMQHCRIVAPPGANLDMTPKFGFSMLPTRYKVFFKPREKRSRKMDA